MSEPLRAGADPCGRRVQEAYVISTEIELLKPDDLDGAMGVLAEFGSEVTVLSGGMSLMPMMNLGLASPERLLSLGAIDELGRMDDEGDALTIGARVTHAEVAGDPRVAQIAPALAAAAASIGDVQVRNRGTIGGSVSHADPSADYLPALCAHNAQVVLQSQGGVRTVDAADFFVDVMSTSRRPDELVTALRIPRMSEGATSAYIRFARVEGSFAIVAAAAVLDAQRGSRLALGGVGPRPVVVDISALGANGWDGQAVDAVGDAAFEASAGAIGDIMSDAEYRREMARVHARRVVRRAAATLRVTK
jgi:carbon-monoxide dehydrogenase medium subunit